MTLGDFLSQMLDKFELVGKNQAPVFLTHLHKIL